MPRRALRIASIALPLAVLMIAGWLALPTLSRHHADPTDVGLPGPLPASLLPTPTATAAASSPSASPTPSPSPSRVAAPSPTPKPSASPRRTSAPPRPSTPAGTPGWASQMLGQVNARRAEAGCGAVRLDSRLMRAAQDHSADQAAHDEMSHTGSDGSDFVQRADRAGYDDAMSENVAAGYSDVTAVMKGWMNSTGHRRNILNCDAKALGVGMARGGDGYPYWTQDFGRV